MHVRCIKHLAVFIVYKIKIIHRGLPRSVQILHFFKEILLTTKRPKISSATYL